MVDPVRKTQADFDAQHDTGWPDFHPEDYCHRCGMPNISWHVDSDVWNLVMRPDGHEAAWQWDEIICPVCFVQLAGGPHVELEVSLRTRRTESGRAHLVLLAAVTGVGLAAWGWTHRAEHPNGATLIGVVALAAALGLLRVVWATIRGYWVLEGTGRRRTKTTLKATRQAEGNAHHQDGM